MEADFCIHEIADGTIRDSTKRQDVAGNDAADEAAKEAAEGPSDRTSAWTAAVITTAVKQEADRKWREHWKEIWKTSKSGTHSRKITAEPTPKTLQLHSNLPKPKSAIGTQLRTGKIGLGSFLFGRKVPGVDTPNCSCDQGIQDVRHVLFTCPRWVEERWEAFGTMRHRNLEEALGEKESFIAAIDFILATGLLGQFRRAREMLIEREEAQI